jgi:AsmA family protein
VRLITGALIRAALRWTCCAALSIAALILMTAAAVDAGYLQKPLTGLLGWRLEHPIQIDGPLHCHLLSWHPGLTAEQVTIRNPPWMPDGILARVDRITLQLTVPGRSRLFRIDRLQLEGTSLFPARDAAGLSNWQLQGPRHRHGSLPLIRSLSMPDAQVQLDDQRHHLIFRGRMSATDGSSRSDPWLRLVGAGQLNGSDMSLAIVGDPLIRAEPDRPYRFTFAERSADARLTGEGSLAGAFRFQTLQAGFEASGNDLFNLSLLTGIRLVHSRPFHLSGSIDRQYEMTRFDNLQATAGASDMHGAVSIDTSVEPRRINVELSSKLLRLTDLGKASATAAQPQTEAQPQKHAQSQTISQLQTTLQPQASSQPLLLSNAAIKPTVLRHGDATVTYHAQRLEAGRIVLEQLDARMTLDQGVATVAPVSARVMNGTLRAQLKMDARGDDPIDSVQLQLQNLQVEHPRFDATVDAQLDITGHGSSAHQLAASANGTLAISVPRGTVRDSLAELSGLDLRGVGLLLTGSRRDTNIRCAAARFDAVNGTLNSRQLVADTDEMVIRGGGSIALDTEEIDMTLAGHPKHTRLLRVRAPLRLNGTLRHPGIGVKTPRSVQLIDRGEAQDVDCNAALTPG